MKANIISTLAILVLSLGGSLAHGKDSGTKFYRVERVVDGDTFVLGTIGKVRLLGVDTPETKDPRKPVQYFGKEASDYLKKLISGKKLRLEYDQQRKDRYGRTLGYAYLENGTFVNANLVEKGYAHAYIKYPFRYMEQFVELERKARTKFVGLWAEPKTTKVAVVSSGNGKFKCGQRKTCKQLGSCEEAKFLLNECGFSRLDGDSDGIPCETLCN